MALGVEDWLFLKLSIVNCQLSILKKGYMLKHTKIVATVSDQRCEVEFIDALYKAGMNVVRLNTAHMAEEGLTRVVNNVRTVSNRIGILMDTKGPEVRTTAAQAPIEFRPGKWLRSWETRKGRHRMIVFVSHTGICQ